MAASKAENNTQTANSDQPLIRLKDFEGPLDLLLHLIKEAKVDIYDIPIADITQQYMEILSANRKNQLAIAGEYFVMAATLMSIKSAMLLPKPVPVEEAETDEEDLDPRQELVDQLLEYQRYKQAAADLQDKAEIRSNEYTREAMRPPAGLVHEKTAPGVSLEQLQSAFEKVLQRYQREQPVVESVQEETITVAERIDQIKESLKTAVRFEDLFANDVTRENLVTTFMAVLELCRHQYVQLSQTEMFGPLIVKPGQRLRKEGDNGDE